MFTKYRSKAIITDFRRNTSYVGETIENKIRRIVNNKEPIKDGAPLIYTDRSDGVQPEYDIRTDRFEIAIEAMDTISKSHKAKREERHKTDEQKATDKKNADLKAANERAEIARNEGILQKYGGTPDNSHDGPK